MTVLCELKQDFPPYGTVFFRKLSEPVFDHGVFARFNIAEILRHVRQSQATDAHKEHGKIEEVKYLLQDRVMQFLEENVLVFMIYLNRVDKFHHGRYVHRVNYDELKEVDRKHKEDRYHQREACARKERKQHKQQLKQS
jgi:hypothetical protein